MADSSEGSRELALEKLIRREVRAHGRITFERFMEHALYHPVWGYYTSGATRIGAQGDYYTSPDVSPLFGATLGRQIHEMWTLMGEPAEFTVVEWGAGKGLLAADVLGWAGAAHPRFFQALRYLIVEVSPGLRAAQRERLRGLPARWMAESDIPPRSVTGCFISNEVADALPFHRVRGNDGELTELWVVDRDGTLGEDPGEPSTPELGAYLDASGTPLSNGQTAEINLRAPDWILRQVEALLSGWVLAIDYGGTAPGLYGGRYPHGTLACYYRHTRGTDPFERIGEQDITAHVNFSALARAVRDAGGEVAGYTTQAFFLAALGLGEGLLFAQARASTAGEWDRERAAVEQLIRPDGLGGFRVLVARKGAPATPLRGLSLQNDPL
ncbi:MAG: SAM-dependent methyltransferase [Chloroflexota bacterium]|nr:SAM-dependent methyltransferase [Chloroflexota bacterium]